jgi:hypothetical protein
MQTFAVVEDLPEAVNAEVGDAIEELTQLTLVLHIVAAVQTVVLLEEEGPPKEPPDPQRPRDEYCRAGAHHSHGLHQEHCWQQQAVGALPQSAEKNFE